MVGYAVFGEIPSLQMLVGVAIVVSAGFIIMWRSPAGRVRYGGRPSTDPAASLIEGRIRWRRWGPMTLGNSAHGLRASDCHLPEIAIRHGIAACHTVAVMSNPAKALHVRNGPDIRRLDRLRHKAHTIRALFQRLTSWGMALEFARLFRSPVHPAWQKAPRIPKRNLLSGKRRK